MKTTTAVILALTLACAAMAADEDSPTLKVGDPAPKLQVGKWVQGDPVKKFEPGKAYIVEFWATWCGPCRTTIPHLNEIHNKYKDKGLIVIGQDCWERNIDEVPKFIAKMGDKMTYRVALDDTEGSEKGKMAETWMQAANQNGIPAAFLVDTKGRIAWIGHPMSLKEKTIEQVLNKTFDVEKAAAEYEVQAKNEAKTRDLWKEFNDSARKKDWETAEATLGKMEKLVPEEQRPFLDMTRFRIAMEKKEYDTAYKIARTLSDENKDNAMLQNQLAWTIATLKGVEKRDLELAETIAKRANDATKGKDAAILDTVARVAFLKGNKEEAITVQEKAIELADAGSRKSLQKTLESYKAGKVPGEEQE